MPQNSEPTPAGIASVARALESLPGLTDIDSEEPRVDVYEPDFWYPGSVSFGFEESKQGRRLRDFFEKNQVSGSHADFEMGLTIDVYEENDQPRGLIKFYLNENCGGDDNLDERFANFARGLLADWKSHS